jgi:hypothetical protein
MTENTPSAAAVDTEEVTATGTTPRDRDEAAWLPASVAVDTPDDIAYAQRTYVHDDADYCAHGTDGRVIVGVTNDTGEVLLLVNDARAHAILPNCHVEDGDWADVARRTVEESTGIAIDLDGPEVVRAVDHEIQGEDECDSRTHHVLYRARPVAAAKEDEPICEDPDWRIGWFAEVPYEIDDEHGDVLDDIERFLE